MACESSCHSLLLKPARASNGDHCVFEIAYPKRRDCFEDCSRTTAWIRRHSVVLACCLLCTMVERVPVATAQNECIGTIAGGHGDQRFAEQATYPGVLGVGVGSDALVYFTTPTQVYKIMQDGRSVPIAGGGTLTVDGPAIRVNMNPVGFVVMRNRFLIADWNNNRLLELFPNNASVSSIAGQRCPAGGYSGDDGPAADACLSRPSSLTLAHDGSIFFSDSYNHRIRRIDGATGVISTVVGGSSSCPYGGFSGDGSDARRACLNWPNGIAADSDGNIFFGDTLNNRVRFVNGTSWIISTYAGGNTACSDGGFSGDGGSAVEACLSNPIRLWLDAAGDLLVSDNGYGLVHKVYKTNSTIKVVAGNVWLAPNFICGEIGDGADAVTGDYACLNGPMGISTDADGNLLIADWGNARVRKVWASNNTFTTVAGSMQQGYCGDGGPATAACLSNPGHSIFDNAGNLFIADSENSLIRVVWAANQTITTIAGTNYSYCGDGGPATSACFRAPFDLVFDSQGDLLIADTSNQCIRKLWMRNGTITAFAGQCAGNFAGSYCGDWGPAKEACLNYPFALTIDRWDNVIIADTSNNRVRVVWADTGMIETIAGNGYECWADDWIPATSACLNAPDGVAVNSANDVFVAEVNSHSVRKVFYSDGTIVRIAGMNYPDYWGDGGLATASYLAFPTGILVDNDDNILIGDGGNYVIRKIDAQTGIITTIAGGGVEGSCGDNGPAGQACLGWHLTLASDKSGNIYVTDYLNNEVRVIVKAEVIACPTYYSCACGSPILCTNASSFCPGGLSSPVEVTDGYFSLPEDGSTGKYGEELCPLGNYCQGGVRFPCPPGTFGPFAGQFETSSCFACDINTYAAVAGTESDSECLPCPPGSVANASGSAFCTWCPQNTYQQGSSCIPCPSEQYSQGGSSGCQLTPQLMSMATWGTFGSLTPVQLAEATTSDGTAALIADFAVPIPIAAMAALPGLLLVITKCCKLPSACSVIFRRCLRKADNFGLYHYVVEGASPIKHTTAMGGVFSILALGMIIAMSASLIATYELNNAKAALPVLVPVTADYGSIPVRAVASTHWSGIESGILVATSTHGPLCSKIRWTTSDIKQGACSYTSSTEPSSQITNHTFICPNSAVSEISSIDLWLDSTCQSLHVQSFAVDAAGVVTEASWATAAACPTSIHDCATLSSIAVAMTLTLDITTDAAGTKHRGFAVLPGIITPPINDDSTKVWLHIGLPLNPWYIDAEVTQATSPSQLASSIIGLLGLLSAFGTAMSLLENLRMRWKNVVADPVRVVRQSWAASARDMRIHGPAPHNEEFVGISGETMSFPNPFLATPSGSAI